VNIVLMFLFFLNFPKQMQTRFFSPLEKDLFCCVLCVFRILPMLREASIPGLIEKKHSPYQSAGSRSIYLCALDVE